MSKKKLIRVGDEIDSYCTTCKLVLAHQVVALVEGVVEKVICKTCGKQHKYRPNPPKSRTRQITSPGTTVDSAPKKKIPKTKKPGTRTRKSKEPVNKWEELFAKKDISTAKMYSMSGVFEQDDVIAHKTFGYGLVTEIRAEGKMRVLFQKGMKLLVFGRDVSA
jgi:hypothetical protein